MERRLAIALLRWLLFDLRDHFVQRDHLVTTQLSHNIGWGVST